jgi:DNA-binding NtrC family response regulator
MKIMIIDDDPLSLAGLKMMLEQQGGFETEAYQNPLDAVTQYLSGKFDAVITDLRMPEISGLEVVQRIHQINPEATVIMISGHEVQPADRETIGKHCCCFFPKPLRANTILEALHKLIRSHHKRPKA